MNPFPHVYVFTPKEYKIIPKFKGQSRVLQNGNVECWFTREQWDDARHLCNMLLDGESNLMSDEDKQVAAHK